MQRIAQKFGRRLFLYLAILVSMLIAVDIGLTQWVGGMERTTFDWLVKNRIHYAVPDREIVIVDIDDASIRELSTQYGRWPWPREVIGTLIEKLAAVGPRAIVFDIAFSEPDKLNPDSDRRFVDRIRQTKNVFFPMVLLDENDTSRLPLEKVPGTRRISPLARDGDNVSVLLPFFFDVVAPGRIGTNNITPDKDGVIRRFAPTRERNGWEIPSIAFQVARTADFPTIANRNFLVNWRGPPFSYTFASFSHVLAAPTTGPDSHLKEDFGGKIVIIGSTAASLFDIKASPMAHVHPGVEMLATVIDNFKNNDPLRELPPYIYGLAAIAFVCLLAFAFHSERSALVTDGLFFVLQVVAVGICYLVLNFSNTYLDMTVPIAFSIGYFTVARIYAHYLSEFRTNQATAGLRLRTGSRYRLTVMALKFPSGPSALRNHTMQVIDKALAEAPIGASRTMHLFESSQLLADLFRDVGLVYWIAAAGDFARQAQIENEVDRLSAVLKERDRANGTTKSVASGFLVLDENADAIEGQGIVIAAIQSLVTRS